MKKGLLGLACPDCSAYRFIDITPPVPEKIPPGEKMKPLNLCHYHLGDLRSISYPFRVKSHHYFTYRVRDLDIHHRTLSLALECIPNRRLVVASSKMSGADRRAFQAAMTLKYCQGNARLAERVFGWGRETVQLGLHEHRTGIICLGMQPVYGGDKLWEAKHPEVAQALWALAELHSQQDPTFRTLLSYTRLTAAEALKQSRAQGFQEEQLPSSSTMADVLNRNGYRLRKVLKAKPLKKLPETDAIPSTKLRTGFANIKAKDKTPPPGRREFRGRWTGQAPQHRLQSHGEYRGLRTGREDTR
jgi:hypothetical protein